MNAGKMRRSAQQMTQEACLRVLQRGTSGVLSLVDADGLPYGVPLSYAWVDEMLVFHGALEGKKLECMRKNKRASFCVVDRDEVIPEKYTTAYRSVIVRGQMEVVEDKARAHALCMALAMRFFPDVQAAEAEYHQYEKSLCMMVLRPDDITGKIGLELLKKGANE